MARDESRVGPRAGASVGYITLDAENGNFKFQDGSTTQTLSVYLDRIDLEFKPAIGRIPDRWHINMIVTTKSDTDTSMRPYQIQLSSHWKSPIVPNLMNGIAGAMDMPAWEDPENRFMILWTARKPRQGKDDLPTASAFKSETRGDFLPNKFPWNENGRFYEGVPADLALADTFWLSVAHALCKATGGNVVGADGASIPMPAPAALGLSLSETPPPAAPPVTPPAGLSIVDKAKAFLTKEIADGKVFIETVGKAFAALTANNATGGDFRMFAAHCTNIGLQSGALPYGHIKMDGSWEQAKPPVETTPPPVTDELPF